MKRPIILTLIISVFILTGCTTNQLTNTDQKIEKNQPSKITASKNVDTDKLTEKTNSKFSIPEIGIKIVFPNKYTITKNREENRRGSFVSYDFNYQKSPSFQEIQFFTKESIKQFAANCEVNTTCFFGDYPDLTRYNGQKNAFKTGKAYKEYELKKFNNRNYFVSNFKCIGARCVIREYTTFIGNTKIDMWITMADNTQINTADNLFEKFEIIE
jgi:hypothetical protein